MWIKALNGSVINMNMCVYYFYNKNDDTTYVKLASDKMYGDMHEVSKGDKTMDISQRLASNGIYMDFTKGSA